MVRKAHDLGYMLLHPGTDTSVLGKGVSILTLEHLSTDTSVLGKGTRPSTDTSVVGKGMLLNTLPGGECIEVGDSYESPTSLGIC
jgi:hypothetical protein